MRFSNGDEVEVTWDDEGFRGAWYEARVVRTMSKTRRYSVVYDHLLAEDNDDGVGENRRRLREIADYSRVRPRPPRRGGPFAPHQLVDVWHNDGWWTGVVVEVAAAAAAAAPVGGSGEDEWRYTVCFPIPREQMEFAAPGLRAHLEWVDDVWVRPDENTPGPEELPFPVGTQVEVVRRMGDSHPVWFVAVVEKHIWENNLLVRYENMRTRADAGAGGEFLREIVDAQYVRPCPPLVSDVWQFSVLEEVEVFHDDSWCAGVITRIHAGSKYSVESEQWEGEMEFGQSKMRPQCEWIDSSWVQPSRSKYVKSPKPHQVNSARHSQRSHTRNGACKSRGSVFVPISSDSQDSGTSSDTEMGNGTTFKGQSGTSLSCKNLSKLRTAEDDTLLLRSLIDARVAKSTVRAEKEFGPPAMRKKGKFCVIESLTVQQPCFKKQSEGVTAENLNFHCVNPSDTLLDKISVEPSLSANFQGHLVQQSFVDIYELPVDSGENGIPLSDKLGHQLTEQNYYSSSVNHEIQDPHHHLKWALKRTRRPRMNALPQKRKEMGRHAIGKRRCRGRPSEAKVLDTEASLEGQSLADPQDIVQLADKDGGEPSQGSLHLLQLDLAVEADPSPGGLAGEELLGMTVSTCARLNEISDGMQLMEPTRERQNEAVSIPPGGCEPHEFVNEEIEVATDVIPCGSTSKLNLPFVKSSSMWDAIETMEVLHALPQQPHFRPLLKYCSELREGMAIGLMVTFDKLVTNITKLQISDPDNIFEERLKTLSHLEDHGFSVQCVQGRLEKLLKIKHDRGQHEEKKTTLQGLILKRQNEGQKLTDDIEMIDTSVKELEKALANLHDRRTALAMQRETNEHEIAKLQIDEKAAMQASLSVEDEFDSTLAAAW